MMANWPVCGRELERGWVCTKESIGVFFLSYHQKLKTFYTSKNIEEDGGIVLDGPHRFRFNETKIYAEVCRNCRKIMMEY